MSGAYILVVVLLFLSLYFVISKKEYFTQAQCNSNCYNLDNGNCGSLRSAGEKPDNLKIVCPTNPDCIGKCINMFTWTKNSSAGILVNNGELKDENYKDYYFCTRCNECIDNFYNNMTLVNTPHQKTCG